jgi:hypothetical protein
LEELSARRQPDRTGRYFVAGLIKGDRNMDTVVKVRSDEEVRVLRSGHWAAMLDPEYRGTVAYVRFDSYSDREEWLTMGTDRIVFPAHCVPLSLLLDREAWKELQVHLPSNRNVSFLFANH